MLKRLCFGVKDVKAGAFTADPIFALTKGMAIRGFTDAVNDPSLPFNKHPGDYQLWMLGELDVVSGVLTPLDGGPECLGDAAQFLLS